MLTAGVIKDGKQRSNTKMAKGNLFPIRAYTRIAENTDSG